MPEGKTKNLPDKDPPISKDQQNRNTLSVSVDTLNYQANDIAELRKLADNHPELAKQIVKDRRRENEMSENSYRLGVVVTSILKRFAFNLRHGLDAKRKTCQYGIA